MSSTKGGTVMKKCRPAFIIVSSIGLMSLLYACSGTQMGDGPAPGPPTVEIDKNVHFLTPAGEAVVVGPGAYEVKAEKDGLRLIAQEGTGEESLVVEATPTDHKEKPAAPTALSFSEKEDEKVVVLLLPNGKGWEAQGSYSGVTSRKASRRSPRSRAQWSRALQLKRKIPQKAGLALSAVSVQYRGITKRPYQGRKSRNTWRLPVSDTLNKGSFTFEWNGYQAGSSGRLTSPPSVKLFINGRTAKLTPMKFPKSGNLKTTVHLSSARANQWPKTVKLELTTGKKKLVSASTKIYADAVSYYAKVLHPIFSHDRCTTCHTLETHDAIVEMHQDRLGAASYPYENNPEAKPQNPTFCANCHNAPNLNNEWFSPAAVQGINWKGWSAGRTCAKVTGPFTNENGVQEPPFDHDRFDHHFHEDPRILWAVNDGMTPYGTDLDVPLPDNQNAWFNKVDPWVDAGTPCPKWRFFKRPRQLQQRQVTPRR